MYRSAVVCSILFAFITVTCSKSIGSLNNEDVENATDSSVTSDVPTDQDQLEIVSEPSAKESLLVLIPPASEEEEEIDCVETEGYSQKTKRCKTPSLLGAPSPMTGKEEIPKTIQDQMKLRDAIVGASRNVPLAKTDVFDDGKYICYCQLKDEPSDQTPDPRPQQSTKKIKPERKNDDRNSLVGSKQQKPATPRLPYRPSLPKKPNVSPQPSRLQPKIKQPVLPQKGRERIPYIPYGQRANPAKNPTKFNIPLNSGAAKPDSIVGQQAPIAQQSDSNQDQQMVGQPMCPSNAADQTLTQSPGNVPTADQQEASNVYDNNLRSEPPNPVEDGTGSLDGQATSIPLDSQQPDDSNVQAIGPESTRKGNEYETTDSGVLDYSDIREVTDAYFTSKAYTDETEHGPTGYDGFPVTAEDRGYSTNVDGRLNGPEEDRTVGKANPNVGNANSDSESEEEEVVGENNPNFDEESDNSSQDITRESVNESEEDSPAEAISELTHIGLSPPDDTDKAKNNEGEYLGNDGTIESPEQGISEEEERVSSMADDYATKGDSTNEDFATEPVTNFGNDGSIVGSPLNDANENAMYPSHQLPFCDNSLLQGTIKSVVNDFVKDPSGEVVGAAKDQEFRPEIVGIPNLKNVLTMPPIEKTIMDRVKDRLSKIITIDRNTFDNDKTTNIIRNTLRHLLSAAPISKTEESPMTVDEDQFKDGQWDSDSGALEPETDGEAPTSLDKMKTSVRDLIRDPVLGMQAAKHPVVQNMIVESVRNALEPGNEDVDDSAIRNAMNEELNLMQTANNGDEMTEAETEPDTFDTSTIDMQMLLDIAKEEAGLDEPPTSESATVPTVAGNAGNPVIGAARNGGEPVGNLDDLPVEPNYKSSGCETGPNIVGAPRNEEANDEGRETPLVGMENAGPNLEQSPLGAASDERDLAYLGKITVQNNEDDVQNLRDSELFYVGDGVKLPLEIRKLDDGSYALSISRKVCEHLIKKECPCCVPPNGNIVRTVRRTSDAKPDDDEVWSNRSKRIADAESVSYNDRRRRDSSDDSLHIFTMPVESFAKRYNLSLDLQRPRTLRNSAETGKMEKDRVRNLRNRGKDNVDVNLLRDLLAIHSVPDETREESANDEPTEDASDQMKKEKRCNVDRYRYERNINKDVNQRVEIVTNILNWLRNMILNTSKE